MARPTTPTRSRTPPTPPPTTASSPTSTASTLNGWSPDGQQAGPLFPAGNVGELSVRWNPIARSWLALWNENDGIHHRIVMRAGVRQHGPWTEPSVVFELSDGLGKFIH